MKTILRLGFCRRDRLSRVEISFGVGKAFEMFDLQAPIFIGNDV